MTGGTSAGDLPDRGGDPTHQNADPAEPVLLTAVFERDRNGWVQARLLERPQVISCGRDLDEARAMIRDALREDLAAPASRRAAPVGEEIAREPLRVTIAARTD